MNATRYTYGPRIIYSNPRWCSVLRHAARDGARQVYAASEAGRETGRSELPELRAEG